MIRLAALTFHLKHLVLSSFFCKCLNLQPHCHGVYAVAIHCCVILLSVSALSLVFAGCFWDLHRFIHSWCLIELGTEIIFLIFFVCGMPYAPVVVETFDFGLL